MHIFTLDSTLTFFNICLCLAYLVLVCKTWWVLNHQEPLLQLHMCACNSHIYLNEELHSNQPSKKPRPASQIINCFSLKIPVSIHYQSSCFNLCACDHAFILTGLATNFLTERIHKNKYTRNLLKLNHSCYYIKVFIFNINFNILLIY